MVTDWPGVVIWAPFETQKIQVLIFEIANLSAFGIWKLLAKEDLNRQKQVFLHNFRSWSVFYKIGQNLVYFLLEKVCARKFGRVKAGGFWFRN